uniref:Small GTP-binding protein n=1 Tax=Babesia gibsoni TaxID=33632 RepID=Q8MZS7_BABGI|nr:small GTP-binding protein [Babesia gibsoni]
MATKKSYKTVLLGDASVGKSSFAVRLTRGEFSDNTNSTIGAAFFAFDKASQPSYEPISKSGSGINVTSDDRHSSPITIKFDIWDTAGQERFKSIAPIYYRGSACAIVVLDISSPSSLQHAASWVKQLRASNDNDLIVMVVANKVDLLGKSEENAHTLANAREYAKENSLLFVETSAKTGQNISAVFEILASEILKNPQRFEKPSVTNGPKALRVEESSSSMVKLKCCNSS